jgi:hypothetical protein
LFHNGCLEGENTDFLKFDSGLAVSIYDLKQGNQNFEQFSVALKYYLFTSVYPFTHDKDADYTGKYD